MKISLSKTAYLLGFISVVYCYFYSIYVYDGYHFGLILSNALDLNNGKIPYKEIFIEYGYLTTLIHSKILNLFGNEVLYLQIYTSIIYSITLISISFIVKKFTNEYLALISLIILILIYPIPLKPWAIYNSYFFYTLSITFFLREEKVMKFISGLCLSFSYLSFTTVYNYILIPLISSIIIFYIFFYYKKKEEMIKLLFFILGILIPIFIFLIYLINLNILDKWFSYQKIPVLFALELAEKNILQQLIFFINEITINSIKNYIVEPHHMFFGSIFFITIYFLTKELFDKIKEKAQNTKKDDLIIISFFILALTPHAQIGGIEKYTTSYSLGIILILILLYRVKSTDFRYFMGTFFIFTVILITINNYIHPEYSALKIDTLDKTYNVKKIKFFNKQKWTKKKWDVINGIIANEDIIDKRCNINSSLNLTDDAFYYSILKNKNQLIPFVFSRHGDLLRRIVEPNFYTKNQKKIFDEKIFIITSKNNHKLFNIENYSILKKYNIDEGNLNLNNISIMIPTSCLKKINFY